MRLNNLPQSSQQIPPIAMEACECWCYFCGGEFCSGPLLGEICSRCLMGDHSARSSSPYIVILELVDRIGHVGGLSFSVWSLDDSTFEGTRAAIASLLDKLQSLGPNFSL